MAFRLQCLCKPRAATAHSLFLLDPFPAHSQECKERKLATLQQECDLLVQQATERAVAKAARNTHLRGLRDSIEKLQAEVASLKSAKVSVSVAGCEGGGVWGWKCDNVRREESAEVCWIVWLCLCAPSSTNNHTAFQRIFPLSRSLHTRCIYT
jgi:hypothetical protein